MAAEMCSLARHNRVEELVSMLHRNNQVGNSISIDERDKYGNTVLTTACQNGLKKMAKLALRQGADINLRNFTSGNTPLHFCFKYGYGDTLGAYLISKGANDAARNHGGQSCYEVAPRVSVHTGPVACSGY
jgi:ankyrin repeat protein